MRTPEFILKWGRSGAAGLQMLLGLPLLYKLLVANIAIVLAATVTGTAFTARVVRADPTVSILALTTVLTLAGVGVSALANLLILKLALSPLRQLERAAGLVQDGDLGARAVSSPLADPDLRRLTETFNGTVANLMYHRRRLREAAASALRAAETERKRIALELHDDTAPTLVALLARVGAVRATNDPAARDAQLEDVRNGLASAIEGVRRVARALRPVALEELGVVAAVREHARSVAEATGLRIDVDADAVDRLLASDAELALYRVVQEALSNVIRHADARRARVRIRRRADAIVAAISDDGRGFLMMEERQRTDRGIGLVGMQERTAYLGGHVDILSRPGRGTSVRVTIPLAMSDGDD